MQLHLEIERRSPNSLSAGYSCPCGCHPQLSYERGDEHASEGCCCGNQFVVGPTAGAQLTAPDGFRREVQWFKAPWDEKLQAAWMIGPSTHSVEGAAHHHEASEGKGEAAASVIDPVCGMSVEPGRAKAAGLHSAHAGADYYFCGNGCKLDFDEEPGRYLDPSSQPSM